MFGEKDGDRLALAFEIFSGVSSRQLLATSANLERLGWACCHPAYSDGRLLEGPYFVETVFDGERGIMKSKVDRMRCERSSNFLPKNRKH